MTNDPSRTQEQDPSQSELEDQRSTQRNPSVEEVNRKKTSRDRDIETDQNQDERQAS